MPVEKDMSSHMNAAMIVDLHPRATGLTILIISCGAYALYRHLRGHSGHRLMSGSMFILQPLVSMVLFVGILQLFSPVIWIGGPGPLVYPLVVFLAVCVSYPFLLPATIVGVFSVCTASYVSKKVATAKIKLVMSSVSLLSMLLIGIAFLFPYR